VYICYSYVAPAVPPATPNPPPSTDTGHWVRIDGGGVVQSQLLLAGSPNNTILQLGAEYVQMTNVNAIEVSAPAQDSLGVTGLQFTVADTSLTNAYGYSLSLDGAYTNPQWSVNGQVGNPTTGQPSAEAKKGAVMSWTGVFDEAATTTYMVGAVVKSALTPSTYVATQSIFETSTDPSNDLTGKWLKLGV